MYPVSANFHTLAIQDAPKTRVRIYFIGDAVDCTDDNAVQTNGTLLIGKAGDTDSNGRIGQNGITFSEFFNPDKNIQVGAAVSSQIGMTLLNTDGALDNFQYGRCKVYLDVYDTANSSWLTCPMGVYIIDLPTKRKVQLINATGYDQMQKLDEICDAWWSALNWSGGITLSQLLTSLATQVGVSVSSNTASAIVNGSVSFTEEPFQCIEVTYREVLEYIAEATGTVARFDRNGALDLRWFAAAQISGNTVTVNTDTVGNQCLAISVAEYSVAAVDLLKVKLYTDDIGTTVGTGTNQYTIVNNLFLDGADSSAIIAKATPIYNRLHGLGAYSPVSARVIMDWSIEAGDIINIVHDSTTYSVPIFQQSMAWRGGYVVSDLLSDGDNVRPVLDYDERTYYRLNSEMSKKVGDNEIISKINQSPESITIQANKVNLTGYVTFTNLSTPGQTTIDGGNITTGTIDASVVNVTNINASNITTGALSADYINGGVLELGGPSNYRGEIKIYPESSNLEPSMVGSVKGGGYDLWGRVTRMDTSQTTRDYYINNGISVANYYSKAQETQSGTLETLIYLAQKYDEATNPFGQLVLNEYAYDSHRSRIEPTQAIFLSANNSATTNVSESNGNAIFNLKSSDYSAALAASQTDGKSTLQLLTNTSSNHDGTVRVDGIYLDTSGSTFDSVIDVTPRRCYASLSSAGWYRVLSFFGTSSIVQGSAGTAIKLNITRQGSTQPAETHSITYRAINGGGGAFVGEESLSGVLWIDKIRAMYTGTNLYIDIHYAGTDENSVSVEFDVYDRANRQSYYTAKSLQSVGASPSGETELTKYTFVANTAGDALLTAISSRGSITSGKAVRVGKIIHVNFVLSTTVSASNSPQVASTNRALCEAALSCIDITNGISSSITSAVPCGVGTGGSIYMKEIIANHIYAITGQFIAE